MNAASATTGSVVWIEIRVWPASVPITSVELRQVVAHVEDVGPLGDQVEAASNGVVGRVEETAVVQNPHDLRRHGRQRTGAGQPVAPVNDRTSLRFRYRSPASRPYPTTHWGGMRKPT